MTPSSEPVAQQVASPSPEPPQGTANIYAAYCVACHGVNGEGTSAGVALNTTTVREQAQQ
jgi:cytochrome c